LFWYPPSQPGPRWPRRQSPRLVLCLQPKQKRRTLTRHRRCPCCCRGTRTALLCDDSFCQAVNVGLVAAALQGVSQGHSHYTTDIQLRQCSKFRLCAIHSAYFIQSDLFLRFSIQALQCLQWLHLPYWIQARSRGRWPRAWFGCPPAISDDLSEIWISPANDGIIHRCRKNTDIRLADCPQLARASRSLAWLPLLFQPFSNCFPPVVTKG
jgi:hypothetical protein